MPALLARGGVTGAAADRALRRQHDRQPPSPPGGRSLPARRIRRQGTMEPTSSAGCAGFCRVSICLLTGSIGGRSAADRLVADRAESTFATSGTRKSALP